MPTDRCVHEPIIGRINLGLGIVRVRLGYVRVRVVKVGLGLLLD